MSPLTKITCNPYAAIPEKCVDHEIASDCERAPELPENLIENARGEDCIGETRSRYGKNLRHSAPQRAVSEIDSALEYKYRRDHSQNKAPNDFRTEHGHPHRYKIEMRWGF